MERTLDENRRIVVGIVGGSLLGGMFFGFLGAVVGGLLGAVIGESRNQELREKYRGG